MKLFLLPFVLVTLSGPLIAADTAYEALQNLVEKRGESVLESVFMVRGEGGGPQPAEWIVYRGQTNAPSFQAAGIRSGGSLSTGTAPAAELGLAPHARRVNFSVLNVDSNAAWNIAKREARKENFRFGRVDYELITNSMAGAPAWNLLLYNEERHYVGKLTISGATGEILHPLKLHRYTVEDIDGLSTLVTVREPWPRRAVRSVGRWFSQTGTIFGRDLLRAAGTTEQIVIGRRTRNFAEDVE